MLTKLKIKSNEVLGLSFHIKRPWILASLGDGGIELWDYGNSALIERFDRHKGPVRGVHFHKSKSLFVSGGDDFEVKVWNWNWNYDPRRVSSRVFSLLGHAGSVRTVQFHDFLPWMLSASEDKTIRIWNWQSRTSLAVLTGHVDAVSSASFHASENLLLSSSMDMTVRIWYTDAQTSAVVNHHVLTGRHTSGVNWVSFHLTLPFIVAGSNEQVKMWRMVHDYRGRGASAVKTLTSPYSSVNGVILHSRPIIVSLCHESITVSDSDKGTELQTFPLQHRFSTLAVHPEINLLAAGHKTGIIVLFQCQWCHAG